MCTSCKGEGRGRGRDGDRKACTGCQPAQGLQSSTCFAVPIPASAQPSARAFAQDQTYAPTSIPNGAPHPAPGLAPACATRKASLVLPCPPFTPAGTVSSWPPSTRQFAYVFSNYAVVIFPSPFCCPVCSLSSPSWDRTRRIQGSSLGG